MKSGNLNFLEPSGLGYRIGQGAAVLFGRSRDRFPVVSLDFSLTYSFRHYHSPGVDSAPSENEFQEHFMGVKAADAWGWQLHHLHVPNVMKFGSLNLLEHSGLHRACYGTPPPYTVTWLILFMQSYDGQLSIFVWVLNLLREVFKENKREYFQNWNEKILTFWDISSHKCSVN